MPPHAVTATLTLQRLLRLRATNHASSPLLRLPRELRDQILGHVIRSLPRRVILMRNFPATLRACHQLREETAELFYTRKILICLPTHERRLSTHLDPSHKQYLRCVCVIRPAVAPGKDFEQEAARNAHHMDTKLALQSGTVWIRHLPRSRYHNGRSEHMR